MTQAATDWEPVAAPAAPTATDGGWEPVAAPKAQKPAADDGWEPVQLQAAGRDSAAAGPQAPPHQTFDAAIRGDNRGIVDRLGDAGAAANAAQGGNTIGGRLWQSAKDLSLGPITAIPAAMRQGAAAFNALQTQPPASIQDLYGLARQEPTDEHFGALAQELSKRTADAYQKDGTYYDRSTNQPLPQNLLNAGLLASKGWANLTPQERDEFHKQMSIGIAFAGRELQPGMMTPDVTLHRGSALVEGALRGVDPTLGLATTSSNPEISQAQAKIVGEGEAAHPIASTAGNLAGAIVNPTLRAGGAAVGAALAPVIGETGGVLNAARTAGAAGVAKELGRAAVNNAAFAGGITTAQQIAGGHMDSDEVLKQSLEQGGLGAAFHGTIGAAVEAYGASRANASAVDAVMRKYDVNRNAAARIVEDLKNGHATSPAPAPESAPTPGSNAPIPGNVANAPPVNTAPPIEPENAAPSPEAQAREDTTPPAQGAAPVQESPPAANVFSDSLYERLGVAQGATPADIKTAWRQRAAELHPDRPGGTNETAALINEAGRILLDGGLRREYDRGGIDAVRGEEKSRAVQRSKDIRSGNYTPQNPETQTPAPAPTAPAPAAAAEPIRETPPTQVAAPDAPQSPAKPAETIPNGIPDTTTAEPKGNAKTPVNSTKNAPKSASDILLSQAKADGLTPSDAELTGDNRAALHPDQKEQMTASERAKAAGRFDEDAHGNAVAGMNADQISRYEQQQRERLGGTKAQQLADAIAHYKQHPDPNVRRLAVYAEAEGTGPKQSVPVDSFHEGDRFTIGGKEFSVRIDPDDGSVHFIDHDVDLPHADSAFPDGRMKVDTGSWDRSGRGNVDEGWEPIEAAEDTGIKEAGRQPVPASAKDTGIPARKTTGYQQSLLGERHEGSGIGSKSGSMFGDVSQGPASGLDAQVEREAAEQARQGEHTGDLLASVGHQGLGDAPPGPVQIGQIVKNARGNAQQLIGAMRHLRERFSPIEGRYGSDVAKNFIKVAAAPAPEARDIVASFFRRAFDNVPAANRAQYERDWTDLGRHYRLEDLRARAVAAGQNPADVGQGLPSLPAADVARLQADPHIQKAIALYNKEIAPLLTDIRTRNGMVMNSNAGKMPMFLNLPGEMDGPARTDTSINPNKAFNVAAIGNNQLKMDPRESLEAAVRGHLATDYKQDLVRNLKGRYSVPQAAVVPSASGKGFTGTLRGRTEPVVPVDLAPSDAFMPDVHYLPEPLARAYEKIDQKRGEHDTLFDKAIQLGTKAAVVGDFSPHAARVVAHVGARMAQAGMTPASILPSWFGSNEAAVGRIRQMIKSPIGETMQLLIDRSGSEKGAGFNVQHGTTWLGHQLSRPHEWLFHPEYGVDPMARRVVADAHLRTLFGNDFMDKLEGDLKAGTTTSIEAARALEKKMSDAQFVGLGRKVNATLGFANPQTRSNLLNWASRVMPFISSESGMIPREIAKMANIDVPALVKSAHRGAWGQFALQAAGSLATGAAGVYLAANALNYANTRLQTGKGQFLPDNPDGHHMDIFLAPNWFLSNLDPTFSRGARLTGATGKANGQPAIQSAARENLNEIPATLAKTLQVAFTAATAIAGRTSAPRFTWDDQGKPGLLKTDLAGGLNIPVARNTAAAVMQGKPAGPAIAQDAASTLLGAQVKHDDDQAISDREYFSLQDKVDADAQRIKGVESLSRQIAAADRASDWQKGASLRKERQQLLDQPRQATGRDRGRLEQLRQVRAQIKNIQQRIQEGSMDKAAGEERLASLRAALNR